MILFSSYLLTGVVALGRFWSRLHWFHVKVCHHGRQSLSLFGQLDLQLTDHLELDTSLRRAPVIQSMLSTQVPVVQGMTIRLNVWFSQDGNIMRGVTHLENGLEEKALSNVSR